MKYRFTPSLFLILGLISQCRSVLKAFCQIIRLCERSTITVRLITKKEVISSLPG
uniref:Uncharacterized protein n=1 Tax=Anguilla anguilla TaxID=7936 RepID=A0A0E9P7D6_ANGAN